MTHTQAMLESLRRALRRMFERGEGIKVDDRPTYYVKAYDEGRPKH